MGQQLIATNKNNRDYVTWIKEGWKTSEFWMAIGLSLVGLFLIGGLFGEGDGWVTKVNNISGAIMIIGPVISYILSRGKAKQNTASPELMANVATLLEMLSETNKNVATLKQRDDIRNMD